MISPHYETSRSIVDVDMDKPFIITASEHQIVFQDYKDLSKEFQCLNIYNDDGIWRTEAFGPIREIDVNRITKYWEKYIPVKAFINDHLFAVSYVIRKPRGEPRGVSLRFRSWKWGKPKIVFFKERVF